MLLKQLFAGLEQSCPEIRFKGNLTEWHRMSLRDIVTPYTDYLPTPTDGYTRLGIRSYMKGTFVTLLSFWIDVIIRVSSEASLANLEVSTSVSAVSCITSLGLANAR